MVSRTPEGKHVTRFIVLKKSSNRGDEKFVRSYNIPEFFATRELALAAVAERGVRNPVGTLEYRVRQK
jgi:hypothetical protein